MIFGHPRKDEVSYFEGVIGRDNGDSTYRVEFDDGDILEEAPRRDIRVARVNPESSSPAGRRDTHQV